MIPGITASFPKATVMAPIVALPLTYDEQDYSGLLTWTRQGDFLPSPEGGVFDSYQNRLKANSSLPSWITSSSGPLTLHASITAVNPATSGNHAIVVSACTDDANYRPKMAFTVTPDVNVSDVPLTCFMYWTSSLQQKPLGRNTWKYGFRYPELTAGSSSKARPQAITFLDADTVLVIAHYDDTKSRAHRVRLSDGVVTGWFEFSTSYKHIASSAFRADGSLWVGDYDSKRLLRIDLAASLASNSAVITYNYNMAALTGFGAIEWVTISGTEYLLAVDYLTSGTPYLYVIDPSTFSDGGTYVVTNRVKRFVASLRSQGVRHHGGKLYLTMNLVTGDASATGKIQCYTLDLGAADGATLAAEATWQGPSQYVEDIDFHPTTGEFWTGSEGYSSVGSDDGWLAYWSSPLDGQPVENHYTAHYDGAGSVTLKINNRLFEVISYTPTQTPGCITVGGRPTAAAGWANNFFGGYMRNMVVQSDPLSDAGYAAAIGGSYEPSSLHAYPVALTNSGAEAGDASGWTNESGALAVRIDNPYPHSGVYYFYDAANATLLARQRQAIPAPNADVDAGKVYARLTWWQATYSTGSDVSACGLRCLDATPTQLSQAIAAEIQISPTMAWRRRSMAVQVPAGARNIDALIKMTRASGTANDGYTDDISLTLYAL